MPTFSTGQSLPPTAQDARLSAPARFTAARALPAPAQAAGLLLEDFPDVGLSAEQQVPQPKQAARLALALWRGPAEPRPAGTPATPRP